MLIETKLRLPSVLCALAALFTPAVTSCGGDIADAALGSSARVFDCQPGPWGRVQWHYLHLEAPDWILEIYATPNSQPVWCFPNASNESVRKLFSEAGLDAAMIERWLGDKRAVLKGPQAITLFPSAAEVEGLSAATRTAIYRELARAAENEHYVNPLCILDRDVDEFLGRRKVRPDIRDLFKRLTYLRGSVLCFSDLPVLLSHAQNDEEMQDFVKLFTRTRGVMAYLQVNEDDDARALAKYWTAAFRRKEVLPMLHSVSLLPGGGRMGLSHLIPAEPRKLLYTYPTLDMAAQGRLPDCHWTSLNFFNYRPKNILLDLRAVANRMIEGHEKVSPPYQYGDVLFFIDKAGIGFHSCTYLCDDLVFTKNGEPLTAPWVISQLEDLRRRYESRSPFQIQAFRRNWDKER